MPTDVVGTLVKLSETNLTVADSAEDVRGRTVVDNNGEEIGQVNDLLIDDQKKNVRFLELASGGVLGIGEQHFLVPVEAMTGADEDRVRIDREHARMRDVPTYDPNLAYDPGYYSDIYGWWGFAPYWGTGETSPSRPYRP